LPKALPTLLPNQRLMARINCFTAHLDGGLSPSLVAMKKAEIGKNTDFR
jgi:hypothetical protein